MVRDESIFFDGGKLDVLLRLLDARLEGKSDCQDE